MNRDPDKEMLRQASVSAEAMIKKLRSDKDRIDSKIASLQLIIDGYAALIGRKNVSITPTPGSLGLTGGKAKRVTRGLVETQIDSILGDYNAYDEPTIRKKLEERFSVQYGRSTVYSNLQRKLNQKYGKRDERWYLLEQTPHEAEGMLHPGPEEEIPV